MQLGFFFFFKYLFYVTMGFCCGSSSMKQRENTEHGANSWSKKYYGPWAQSVQWIGLGRKPNPLNMRNFGQKPNSCVGCNFDLLGFYMSLVGEVRYDLVIFSYGRNEFGLWRSFMGCGFLFIFSFWSTFPFLNQRASLCAVYLFSSSTFPNLDAQKKEGG